ncbi:kinesin-like protein KIF28 [Centruroides vittatus]|uniref:kinesin-like protein KIF28 n=1 Tax=Centruroides vittatus TaxID=120091 RepID=UPI00350FFB73
MPPDVENVKVAVRMLCYNSREQQRRAKTIIAIEGNTTFLSNPDAPNEKPKNFTYDFSYWSHDGFKELKNGYLTPDLDHPNGHKFSDQDKVYSDLGRGVLKNAWDGYNTALFAYGQTGSGKSWSVIGYGTNTGIVPRFCEEMFQGIESKKNSEEKIEFEVRFSMLEIYNEIVRDLLNPSANRQKGLKVREHPKKGFYAEGLTSSLVANYESIQSKIETGTTNRSIASTNMNVTSSRAHTIVGITLIQKSRKAGGQETSKISCVNLVDLAGSERVSSTGAKGDRLKEGAAINQSLSCLGNCIHALAEKAKGTKSVRVPYRESMLTRLLMNALGGNSKTIMIAAISPADINYDETLSTLRYADRAKEIKTCATVNEDPTEKLIRELRIENEKLKKMLEQGQPSVPIGVTAGMSDAEIRKQRQKWEEEMKAAMKENDRELLQIRQSYEEKLKQAQLEQKADAKISEADKLKQKEFPHFSNLNFDLLLSGKLVHILKRGENLIGKADNASVILFGPCILEKHALVTYHSHGGVTMEKCNSDARILLNGEPVSARVLLSHNDRVMFGTTQLYVFKNPQQMREQKQTYPEITYEMAREEIAAKAGLTMDTEDYSRETALLNKDILEVLPGVEEANAISEELDKHIKFEILLVAPQMLGKLSGRTEVYVKMRNLVTGQEYDWPKEKFINRLFLMKEMFQNYEAGEEWDLPDEQDPFTEDSEVEVMIGCVQVFLQPLAYRVEIKEQLEIIEYRGAEVGIMNIEIVPCSSTGKEYTESDDMFIDDPKDLIGKEFHFVVKILSCNGLPARFFDINCRYRLYLDEDDTVTATISGTTNPEFNHRKMYSFKSVSRQFSEYLVEGFIMIQVWGTQAVRKSAVARAKGKNTKEMFQADIMQQTNTLMNGFRINGRNVDPNKHSMLVELLLMKKQQARHQFRMEYMKKLIDVAEKYKKRKVPINLLKELIATNSAEVADQIISKVPEVDDSDEDDDYDSDDDRKKVRGSSTCLIM